MRRRRSRTKRLRKGFEGYPVYPDGYPALPPPPGEAPVEQGLQRLTAPRDLDGLPPADSRGSSRVGDRREEDAARMRRRSLPHTMDKNF